MNRFTWRSWIATPIAVLGLIAAIAATPPTAEAKANNTTAIELVVVNHDVTVAINVKSATAELKELAGLHVAWQIKETAVMEIAANTANGGNVYQANNNDGTATINVTPTPVTDNTAQVANDTNFKMQTNISPQATSRGGVVLASTAGGGWLESLAALLGGRLDGRVS